MKANTVTGIKWTPTFTTIEAQWLSGASKINPRHRYKCWRCWPDRFDKSRMTGKARNSDPNNSRFLPIAVTKLNKKPLFMESHTTPKPSKTEATDFPGILILAIGCTMPMIRTTDNNPITAVTTAGFRCLLSKKNTYPKKEMKKRPQ